MNGDINEVDLATELTMAWLANPNTRPTADDVPVFLQQMHAAIRALSGLAAALEAASQEYKPAVTARKSLASPDHIISMIDGKPYRTLRRHLARHGMTPEQYRERYNLKSDYPMVAQTYSESRRVIAKRSGLGRKPIGDGGQAVAATKARRAKKAQAPAS